MAVRYYGADVGGQMPVDVTVDTSTTSSDVELAVDDTNLAAASSDKRHQIEMAIEAIRMRLQEDAGL